MATDARHPDVVIDHATGMIHIVDRIETDRRTYKRGIDTLCSLVIADSDGFHAIVVKEFQLDERTLGVACDGCLLLWAARYLAADA